MRLLLTAATITLLSASCYNKSGEPIISIDSVVKKDIGADWLTSDRLSYNAELAAKFGADEYGMKQYVMAYLKRGAIAKSTSRKHQSHG